MVSTREFRLAQAAAQRVVMGEQTVDLGRQRLEIGEIHHPDRAAADLVLVGRADAAPRGADLGAGIRRRVLAQRVELAVQRQDQRGVVGNAKIVGIDDDALGGQPVDFADQRMRVDHHAIADDGELARTDDARGQERQLVADTVDDQRVAGIVAALEADHHVGAFRQPVDNLAFSLVTPLRPDDNHVGHENPLENGLSLEARKTKPAHAYRLGLAKSTLERRDRAFLRDNLCTSHQTGTAARRRESGCAA
jgi:hypothetical protein